MCSIRLPPPGLTPWHRGDSSGPGQPGGLWGNPPPIRPAAQGGPQNTKAPRGREEPGGGGRHKAWGACGVTGRRGSTEGLKGTGRGDKKAPKGRSCERAPQGADGGRGTTSQGTVMGGRIPPLLLQGQ